MKLSPTARATALAALTAAVALFLQILLHRMVSVKLLNNLAFLVISLTMLGFGFSGVLMSRWQGPCLRRLHDTVALCAGLFPAITLGSVAVFYRSNASHFYTLSRADLLHAFFAWMPFAILLSLPFACCGVILALLLSAPEYSSRRVYFADLVGSAVGALAALPAIRTLGVEWSALLGCAALPLGAAVLVPPRAGWARATLVAALAFVGLAAVAHERVFELRYLEGSILSQASVPQSGMVIEHTTWDPLARIEISRIRPPKPEEEIFPCLLGASLPLRSLAQRIITQNGFAFTYALAYDGRRESLRGLEDTIYACAYQASAVTAPKCLVIGVGGGTDLLTSLHFGAADVTGVEVNAATVKILTETYRSYFHHWVEDPRVHLVLDEGRHFLATTDRLFDIIQCTGVDTYSGTPGMVHVFAENYLYTDRAFDLYLSRLTPDGILGMVRLEGIPPREMLRALITAVAALRRAGVRDAPRHVLMLSASDRYLTALLVKKTPFAAVDLDRVRRWAAGQKYFSISAAPDAPASVPSVYQFFLGLDDPDREAEFIEQYPFDVSPVDDDRPFFFRYSRWSHLLPNAEVPASEVPVMEYSVLLLLAVVGTAAAVSIWLPLRWFAGGGLRVPSAGRFGAYFAGIGLGYLAIEIGLLQKFGLFLGHPNYALSVVLASLLVASGVGSLVSARIVGRLGGLRWVSYLLAACVLMETAALFPLLPEWIRFPFALRAAIVVALVAPVGLCMGVFMPSALEQLKRSAPAFAPWAWGLNAVFSVVAPILSMAVAITWGTRVLLLCAVPIYLAVGVLLPAPTEK